MEKQIGIATRIKMALKTIFDFVKVHWVTLVLIGVILFLLQPVQTVPDVSKESIATVMPNATEKEVTHVTERIIERVQSPPDIVYVTKTQVQADQKAKEAAKDADYVFKNPVDDITNNYYAVHTEKEHKVKAGVTSIEKQTYWNVGYQDKKNELILHMKGKDIKGATYMRTVMEW